MPHRMGRKFDSHQILREKDPWDVARNVFDICLEFALLGYVEEATKLFELFKSFSKGCKGSWSPGLYFAWEATGLWPDCIPAEERTPEFLKKLETERILWKRETNATKEGLDKLLATATGEDNRNVWCDEPIRPDDLTAAVDLALFMGEEDKAYEILEIFAENFHFTWTDLSKSRQVWQVLKEKTLARIIEVDEDKVGPFSEDVYNTFKERLEKGARRVFKDLTMKELVEMCNRNTLDNAVWEETDFDEKPTTILQKGATKERIAALEERLGHYLPDDYKEFLSLTDGMDSYWNGFFGEPKLLGTDEVFVHDATEQQEMWNEASVEIVYIPHLPVKIKWAILDRVIQINAGGEDTKYVWFLEPEYTKKLGGSFWEAYQQCDEATKQQVNTLLGYFYAGKGAAEDVEWQCCTWCPNTLNLTVYYSFREFLEYLAGDTAKEDILEEEDEEGRLTHSHDIFAFQLR